VRKKKKIHLTIDEIPMSQNPLTATEELLNSALTELYEIYDTASKAKGEEVTIERRIHRQPTQILSNLQLSTLKKKPWQKDALDKDNATLFVKKEQNTKSH